MFSNTAEIICSDVDQLNNGVITYSSGSQSRRPFNSTANYACELGYNLVGQAMRTCQGDGSWSGQEPVCEGEWSL